MAREDTARRNPPGRTALTYRTGTYVSFVERMRAALATETVHAPPGEPAAPLATLNVKESRGIALALIDAWAVVGDVLTFYQERIINEGYLGTALEKRSLRELIHQIGYLLDPGLAASTYLAFTVSSPPGSPELIHIPRGTAIQSVPGPGQKPQTFETNAPVDARPEWNALRPFLPARPLPLAVSAEDRAVTLQGARTSPRVGAPILLLDSERRWLFSFVASVRPDRKARSTLLRWTLPPAASAKGVTLVEPSAYAFARRAPLFGHDAPKWESLPVETRRRYRSIQGGVTVLRQGDSHWNPANEGLPAQTPHALAFTSDGRLYAALDTGVYRASSAGGAWSPAAAGLTRGDVHALVADGRQGLFAGTAGGGVFHAQDGDTWEPVQGALVLNTNARRRRAGDRLATLPRGVVRCLLPTRDGDLVVGTDHGVLVTANAGDGWRPENHGLPRRNGDTGLTDEPVLALGQHPVRDHLYVATSSGVFQENGRKKKKKKWKALGKWPGPGGVPTVRSLFAVAADRRVYLLAGTAKGLFRLDLSGHVWKHDAVGLPRSDGDPVSVHAFASSERPDGGTRVVAATGAGVFASDDAGEHWSAVAAAAGVAEGPPADSPAPDLPPPAPPESTPTPAGFTAVAVGPEGTVAAAGPFRGFEPETWPDFGIVSGRIDVAGTVRGLSAGSTVVVHDGGADGTPLVGVYQAKAVQYLDRRDFECKGAVTRIQVAPDPSLKRFDLRSAEVFLQGQELPLERQTAPTSSPLRGDTLTLGGAFPTPPPGRLLTISGRRSRAAIVPAATALQVAGDRLVPLGLRGTAVRAMVTSPAGGLFAATEDGVLTSSGGAANGGDADPATAQWTSVGSRLADGDAVALSCGADGTLFAATASGIQRLPQGTDTWLPPDRGLPATRVAVLRTDPEGVIWAATRDAGAFRFDAARQEWGTAGAGLPSADVRDLAFHGGDTFVASARGVFRLPASARDWQPYGSDLANTDVRAVTVSAGGAVVVGTAGGLFRLGADGSWTEPVLGPASRHVCALVATPEGDLYAGAAGGGVWRSGDEGRRWALVETGAANDVTLLAADGSRVLVACTGDVVLTAGDGVGSGRLEVHRVFDLEGAWATSLDQSHIPKALEARLEHEGITLGDHPRITVREAGRAWYLDLPDVPCFLDAGPWGIRVSSPQETPVVLTTPAAPSGGPLRVQVELAGGFRGWISAFPEEVTWRESLTEDGTVGEVATVTGTGRQDAASAVITLAQPLSRAYDATATTVSANVAPATHGTSVRGEVLGSGDGGRSGQSFTLRKPPLTYVPADTPTGRRSTLEVRVNGVPWQGVDSLYGLGALATSYRVTVDESGRAVVTFGDGRSGARLPTGEENVTASYRSGVGAVGNVSRGQLTLLRTPPLGVRKVTNPVEAGGGTDFEGLDHARSRAPFTMRTLDRVISIEDYSDFSHAFPGISKALVEEVWDGRGHVIHITVAPETGGPLSPESPVLAELTSAIEAARSSPARFRVASYQAVGFVLDARVLYRSGADCGSLESRIRSALTEAFAFTRREFGEGVSAAEVVTCIQRVGGVVGADLTAFHLADASPSLEAVLPARQAVWDEAACAVLPAQLMLLSPAGVHLTFEEAS